jgi:hypothetical protein
MLKGNFSKCTPLFIGAQQCSLPNIDWIAIPPGP